MDIKCVSAISWITSGNLFSMSYNCSHHFRKLIKISLFQIIFVRVKYKNPTQQTIAPNKMILIRAKFVTTKVVTSTRTRTIACVGQISDKSFSNPVFLTDGSLNKNIPNVAWHCWINFRILVKFGFDFDIFSIFPNKAKLEMTDWFNFPLFLFIAVFAHQSILKLLVWWELLFANNISNRCFGSNATGGVQIYTCMHWHWNNPY